MSTGNVIGGHKANLANPKTSEESKEHSRQELDRLESEGGMTAGDAADTGKNEGNVIGGHKANLKNTNTSDESKEHSKEVLNEHGVEV